MDNDLFINLCKCFNDDLASIHLNGYWLIYNLWKCLNDLASNHLNGCWPSYRLTY